VSKTLQLESKVDGTVHVRHTPDIPGLSFRGFQGKVDYPAMLSVIEGSKEADGIERTDSLDDIARNYRHLTNCDPFKDMLFVEIRGVVVGYSRVWWFKDAEGKYIYPHFSFMLPEWRGMGIRKAVLRNSEQRLREIAIDHRDGPRFFDAWASESEEHWSSLLESEGYEAVRFGFSMVRPDLENIPQLPLPEGLEIRPVGPDHYDAVWQAAREAFQDEWGYAEPDWSDEEFQSWKEGPLFTPDIWQVAWHGDEVAGMVLNFINEEENQEYGRLRGYTETICVRRPFRRRGLARALIARSFSMLKDRGMAEAALGVDTENPNGALQLYKSMGFKPVDSTTLYRKPMD
jgi:GNAT superfamily N-acetyltransferase